MDYAVSSALNYCCPFRFSYHQEAIGERSKTGFAICGSLVAVAALLLVLL
jgi:hypothetical protein